MYKELYSKENGRRMQDEAMDVLVNDTLRDRIFGKEKSRELTSLDMESKAPMKFVPSMFYTFMYITDEMSVENGNVFHDRVPLILCTGVSGEFVSGINFNLIPGMARAVILDIIYDAYCDFYETAVTESSFCLNEKLASQLLIPERRASLFSLIESMTGIKVSDANRVYSLKNIKMCRMIEYDAWKYIPFLQFKDSVRGAGLASIQKSFIHPK